MTFPRTSADAVRHQEFLDAQPITVGCTLCPDWQFTGPSVEARAAASLHRAELHPAIRQNGKQSKDEQRKAANAARAERENADREATVERGRQRAALEADGNPDVTVTEPVLGEAAVGHSAVSGSAHLDRGEPERAATSPNTDDTDDERASMDRPNTHDAIVAAFTRFRDAHGRLPIPADAADVDYLPTREFARHNATAGFDSWQAVWDHFGAGKLPMGRAAGNYRLTGVLATGGGNASKPKRARKTTTRGPKPRAKRERKIGLEIIGKRPPAALNGSHASKAEALLRAATAVDEAEAALTQARTRLRQCVEELAA